MGTARTRSLPFLSIAPPLQLVSDLAGPPHFRGVLPLEKPAERALHPRGGKVGGDGAELATAVPTDALGLAVQYRDVLRYHLPRHPLHIARHQRREPAIANAHPGVDTGPVLVFGGGDENRDDVRVVTDPVVHAQGMGQDDLVDVAHWLV